MPIFQGLQRFFCQSNCQRRDYNSKACPVSSLFKKTYKDRRILYCCFCAMCDKLNSEVSVKIGEVNHEGKRDGKAAGE